MSGFALPSARAASFDALAFLTADKYAELDEHFATVQRDFERGAIGDEDLRAAFRPFYVLRAGQEAHYDAWVKQRPESYVAYLARAIHYKYVGFESRGEEFIAKTTGEQLAGMDRAFQISMEDLTKSFELTKKPLLSYLHAIDIGMHYGLEEMNRKLLDRANQAAPRNYIVRQKYMLSLRTRWGGSARKMSDFLEECSRVGLNDAQLRTLEAEALADSGWVHAYKEDDYLAAEKDYAAALELVPDRTDFMVEKIGQTAKAGKCGAVIADVSTALQVIKTGPREIWIRLQRARCYLKAGRNQEAFADYMNAAEKGDASAQRDVASFYWNGVGGMKKDRAAAVEWLRKSAEGGNAQARKEYAYSLEEMKKSPESK